MSNERQRQLRLQGRYQPPKSSSRAVGQKLSSLSLNSNDNLPPQVDSNFEKMPCAADQGFSYQRTSYKQEKTPPKPTRPKVLNNSKDLICKWIELNSSKKGSSMIYYHPKFFEPEEAIALFDRVINDVEWEEREIKIDGKAYLQPRMVHWIGPYEYKYSSLSLKPNDTWPESIKYIHDCIKTVPELNNGFNSVLCNLYRNAKDSVAWHSDNELSMGVKPCIASVSLGAMRKFEMKRKLPMKPQLTEDRSCQSGSKMQTEIENSDADWCVHLENGSLFIMDGTTQEDWLHRVPKEYHDRDQRINLTFRTVYPQNSSPKESF